MKNYEFIEITYIKKGSKYKYDNSSCHMVDENVLSDYEKNFNNIPCRKKREVEGKKIIFTTLYNGYKGSMKKTITFIEQ